MKIRIATRKSRLAIWQAEHVASLLRSHGADVELVPMTTAGDRHLETRLDKIGGKGLFIKELEVAMAERRADIAVHSMKDVPANMPVEFVIAAVLEREDSADVLVSNSYDSLDDLPQAARVGTSSIRRQTQILHTRPDLDVLSLRGNVDTRLKKLDDGEFDAIVLAAAGLKRLGLSDRITQRFRREDSLPAIGQGLIGIECRGDDTETIELLEQLDNPVSRIVLTAERAVGRHLNADCQAPVAAHARASNTRVFIDALVAAPGGRQILRDRDEGPDFDAEAVGERLAKRLIERGAQSLLAAWDPPGG